MSSRMIDFLLRLAPRERVLLGVLAGVILPVALVFSILLPLAGERRAAQADLDEAAALDGWVVERQAEMAALRQRAPGTRPHGPAIGASALEQSLIDRRLRPALSELETRDGGEIALRFDTVAFTDLMRWIDAEDPEWGYEITALRLERNDRPAFVEARLTLVPLTRP